MAAKYGPPPNAKLKVEYRIIDGKSRKVETLFGKVARVYDDEGKMIEDRSKQLKVTLPTPPLEIKTLQDKKSEIIPESKEGSKEEPPILDIPQTSEKMNESNESPQLKEEPPILDIPKINIEDVECPQCKSTKTIPLLYLDNSTRYRCKNCEETFVKEKNKENIPAQIKEQTESPIKEETKPETKAESPKPGLTQDLENLIKITEISQKIEVPKVESPTSPPFKIVPPKDLDIKSDIQTSTQTIMTKPNIEDGPKIEIPKTENKKDDIPKIETKIEKDNKIEIPKTENKKDDIPKIETKIEKDNKIEIPKAEKKIENKENKNMVEELLDEYKRDQWAKKRDFEKNIENMARTAAENKNQIEKISEKIEGVTGKVGEVEDKIGGLQENFQEKFGSLQERLGDVKKPVSDVLGELCTGIDCIKTDLKKSQEFQQNFQQSLQQNQQNQQTLEKELETKLENRFDELQKRLEKLEEPTYVCDNCGADSIRPLSSFCSNCGAPIHSWTDPETGNPVSGWAPYWRRARGAIE